MLFLAVKHLFARKRQTLVILTGIALGTMIYVAIASIQLGFREFIIDKLINSDAHVRISGREEDITSEKMTPLFFADAPVKWIIPPSGKRDEAKILFPQGWFNQLNEHPDVLAFAPQFVTQAIFRKGSVKATAQILGIDVERQLKVTNISSEIQEGKLESIGTGGKRIVIGSGLAKKLGTQLSQTILVSSALGQPQAFKIVGIYHSGVQQLDDSMAYGFISDIQQLAGTPGRITSIAIKLNDVSKAKELADLWSLSGKDKVQSWDQANANFLQIFKIQDIVRNFITWTVLMVAAFGIYNVLTIIINQKKREIAILRALGFSPTEIERLFLMQGAIIGIVGATLGLTLGFFLSMGFGNLKFEGAGFDRFMVSYDPSIYLYGLGLATLVSVIAGYLPARSARKMTPIDIIRAEV